MDVLLTRDVISHLSITGSSVITNGLTIPISLFAFSKTHITFISYEMNKLLYNPSHVTIHSKNEPYLLPVSYESSMQTSTKHWILNYEYSPELILKPLYDTWMSLLDISQIQHLRSDVRISTTKANLEKLRLDNYSTELWIQGTSISCSIQNVSFSGARVLCLENNLFEGDDKIVLKIQFYTPSEIASLRAVVLRKQLIDISGIMCVDMAVRFLEPIDLVLRYRLSAFFTASSVT